MCNLSIDMRDGLLLTVLASQLIKESLQPLHKVHPLTVQQRTANVEQVLSVFEKDGLRLIHKDNGKHFLLV